MKNSILATGVAVLLWIALAACTGDVYAQRRTPDRNTDSGQRQGQREGRGNKVDRFERLKQMRLMEELQLGEEEAVRFMAKRRDHESRMKELAGERNEIIDRLGAMIEDKADAGKLDEQIRKVFDSDRKMFQEREAYQSEMQKMLSKEKFARLLIFERDFQFQVRDAMGRSLRERRSKFDER